VFVRFRVDRLRTNQLRTSFDLQNSKPTTVGRISFTPIHRRTKSYVSLEFFSFPFFTLPLHLHPLVLSPPPFPLFTYYRIRVATVLSSRTKVRHPCQDIRRSVTAISISIYFHRHEIRYFRKDDKATERRLIGRASRGLAITATRFTNGATDTVVVATSDTRINRHFPSL
jgi:hypothetical protein